MSTNSRPLRPGDKARALRPLAVIAGVQSMNSVPNMGVVVASTTFIVSHPYGYK